MRFHRRYYLCALVCACAAQVRAAELKGKVIDPSGLPVSGAQVAAITPLGVVTQQITDDKGSFDIYVSPLYEDLMLRVTAAGFSTATVSIAASAIDTPASMQGSSVSVISSHDLRERNEAQAFDLLRETPGVVLE